MARQGICCGGRGARVCRVVPPRVMLEESGVDLGKEEGIEETKELLRGPVPVVLEPLPTPPVYQLDPETLAQMVTADRGESRTPQGDPFARRNKDSKDLEGYVFDGHSGVAKATEWL